MQIEISKTAGKNPIFMKIVQEKIKNKQLRSRSSLLDLNRVVELLVEQKMGGLFLLNSAYLVNE